MKKCTAMAVRTSYRKSLASRIKGIHHALTADELAKMLRLSRITFSDAPSAARFHHFAWALACVSTQLQSAHGSCCRASNRCPLRVGESETRGADNGPRGLN